MGCFLNGSCTSTVTGVFRNSWGLKGINYRLVSLEDIGGPVSVGACREWSVSDVGDSPSCGGVFGCWRSFGRWIRVRIPALLQWPFRRRQFTQGLPDLTQEHEIHRPLPLHRQHTGMVCPFLLTVLLQQAPVGRTRCPYVLECGVTRVLLLQYCILNIYF